MKSGGEAPGWKVKEQIVLSFSKLRIVGEGAAFTEGRHVGCCDLSGGPWSRLSNRIGLTEFDSIEMGMNGWRWG